MKRVKKILAIVLTISLVALCFAGCGKAETEKYNDTTLIIGYNQSVAPFLQIDENGKATGFEADLWAKIFDSVKGDLTDYVFEQVDEGYVLEEDGGFFDSTGKEYSAGLLFGAVSKNYSTFNEEYSFTQPIITNRVIALQKANTGVAATYSDFAGKTVVAVKGIANDTLQKYTALVKSCTVTTVDTIDEALAMMNNGTAQFVVTDEFTYCPIQDENAYKMLDGELDTIDYVIATAKYSGWYWSINEAIRELKSADYGEGDEFTPLVEQYFNYNASQFTYVTDGDK